MALGKPDRRQARRYVKDLRPYDPQMEASEFRFEEEPPRLIPPCANCCDPYDVHVVDPKSRKKQQRRCLFSPTYYVPDRTWPRGNSEQVGTEIHHMLNRRWFR